MTKQKYIKETMEILKKRFPITTTTLNKMREKPDPFKILIACLLSLRAKDENTKKISQKLFEIADTPEKILELPTRKLEKIIYSLGHYHKKAQILRGISKILIHKFESKVPNTYKELISIKGIGPKTANIVLAFAFQKKVLPIDTHCHRIPNRLGWIKTKNPEETEQELAKILQKKYWKEFNSIFVQFGKSVCKPISPLCSKCPIKHCSQINVLKSR
jgi:endonuclease-3